MSIAFLSGIRGGKEKDKILNWPSDVEIEASVEYQNRKRRIINSLEYDKFLNDEISHKELLKRVK